MTLRSEYLVVIAYLDLPISMVNKRYACTVHPQCTLPSCSQSSPSQLASDGGAQAKLQRVTGPGTQSQQA
jgi:hypothetical protein